jgi:hypothetical protein
VNKNKNPAPAVKVEKKPKEIVIVKKENEVQTPIKIGPANKIKTNNEKQKQTP